MAKERRGLRQRLGLDDHVKRREWDDRLALTVGVVGALLIVGAAFGALAMIYRIYTGPPIHGASNPLRVIFSSRLMVTVARLAILFAGLYVVLSVLNHMRRGQWLTAAGPFKVSESLSHLTRTLAERDQQLRQGLRELFPP
jgi:hypothetical protein